MPYSCRKGVCETCNCLLSKGTGTVAPLGHRKHAGDRILSCMASPEGAVEITPAWIERRPILDRIRVKALLYRIVDRSSSVAVLQLRLPIGRHVKFNAGQYVNVLLNNGQSRNYSIANAPHLSDVIHLHVRRVPGGQFSDLTLNALSPGSTVDIELPFGLFGWSEENARPAILLATGTGFAPLKSMLEDLIRRDSTRKVHLFWGGNCAEDIYEFALMTKWSETLPWFRFSAVLATPAATWQGEVGFVQNAAGARYRDLSSHEVYACGNPMMIGQAKTLLTGECNLSPQYFFADAFLPSAVPSKFDVGDTEPSRLKCTLKT